MRLPRFNIAYKFIAYLILLGIVPLLIVSAVSYRTASSTLKSEASRYTLELVINQRDYLDLQMEQVKSLITNLSGVEEVTDALDDIDVEVNTFTSLSTQAKIGDILNSYINIGGLASIDIFTVGGQHYYVGDTLDFTDIRQDLVDKIFNETLDSRERVTWIGIEDNINTNSTYDKVVVTSKALRNSSGELIALLLVNYDVNFLYKHLSGVNLGENAYMIVIDGKNRVIYHPDVSKIGNVLDNELLSKLDNQSSAIMNLDDMQFSVSHVHSELNAWTVIGLVPIKTLTAKADTIQQVTLVVLLFCFVTVFIVGWIYNRSVVTPIRQITKNFQLLQYNSVKSAAEYTYMPSHIPVRGQDEIAELSSWFNTFVDVLERRRQAEQALRRSEERYRRVVFDQTDFVIRWDPMDGTHTFVNESYCRYLDQTPDELMQKSIFSFIPEPSRGTIKEQLLDLVQDITPQSPLLNMEYDVLDKDQMPHIHNWVFRGIFDDSGSNLIEMQSVGRDITGRVEMEQQRLALGLEKERIQILASFITKASHEFRTPLSIINTSTYFIKKSNDPLFLARHVDKIEEQVSAISTLIEALTTMSRLEGMDASGFGVVNVCSIVEMLTFKYRAKNVPITSNITRTNLMVKGDSNYLSLAIEHIINNAIHVTPDNEYIFVECSRFHDHVLIHVRDSGMGISDDVLPHIFERFYRGDESHTTRGFGLGLPIAKAIIELHQGKIDVKTVIGQGTTFIVSLPLISD